MSDYELTPEEFEELGGIVRGFDPQASELQKPPPSVWQSIEDALAAEFDAELETQFGTASPIAAPTPSSEAGRSSRIAKYLLAAAVVAIAAIGLGVLSNRPEETVLATAEISNEGLPNEFPASGIAHLVSVDGTLRLDLDVEQLETEEGYFELWVARPDASEVKSLGAIDGDGRWDWPEGYSPDDFPAVAISLEEDDGDPTFSGIAVLFGQLEP